MSDLLIFGVIIFSAILSFAFFNFPKAKLFLGDGGSYLIGWNHLSTFGSPDNLEHNSNIPSFSTFVVCFTIYFLKYFFLLSENFFMKIRTP